MVKTFLFIRFLGVLLENLKEKLIFRLFVCLFSLGFRVQLGVLQVDEVGVESGNRVALMARG